MEPVILTQGHVLVDAVYLRRGGVGVRVWDIECATKRPYVAATSGEFQRGKRLSTTIYLEVGDDSLGQVMHGPFKGTGWTELELPIPRLWVGWVYVTADRTDKYTVTVVAYTHRGALRWAVEQWYYRQKRRVRKRLAAGLRSRTAMDGL